jgi:TonB family protein
VLPFTGVRSSRPTRWRRARPSIIALGASVALHALVGVGFWQGKGPSGKRPGRPIEVTIVELRPVARPAAPVPPASLATSALAGPARHGASRAGPRLAPSLPADAPPGIATPGEVDLAWAVTAAGGAPHAPDLSALPPPESVALFAPVSQDPGERLDRLLREDARRHDVATGLFDPYFLELGRAITAVWNPEPVVSDRGLSGYFRQLGESAVDYAATWSEQAARYGSTGSPILAAEARHRNFATVRIVQRGDGRLVGVELVRSSSDSAVDAQALRDLRAAAERLPAPTPGALRGRTLVISLWEFELEVSISPPLPLVAVQFDEVLGILDARLPLDRRIHKLVRLISVD